MVEINLLPKEFQKQSQPSPWKYAAMAVPVVTLITLAAMYIPLAANISTTNRKIAATNGNIEALRPRKEQYDQLVARQAELEKVTAVAKTLREQKTYWSNDLAIFSAQVPNASGVALKSLRMTDTAADDLANLQKTGIFVGKNIRRQLEIAGAASSQQSVITFLNTFENNPKFGVNFKGMQREQQSGKFNFTATVGVTGDEVPTTPIPAAAPAPAGSSSGTPAAPAAPAAPPAPATTGGTP